MCDINWFVPFSSDLKKDDRYATTSTNIFYIAVGCACGLILLIAFVVAVYYVRSSKSTNNDRMRYDWVWKLKGEKWQSGGKLISTELTSGCRNTVPVWTLERGGLSCGWIVDRRYTVLWYLYVTITFIARFTRGGLLWGAIYVIMWDLTPAF